MARKHNTRNRAKRTKTAPRSEAQLEAAIRKGTLKYIDWDELPFAVVREKVGRSFWALECPADYLDGRRVGERMALLLCLLTLFFSDS